MLFFVGGCGKNPYLCLHENTKDQSFNTSLKMTLAWIDQQTARQRLNDWGRSKRPFLFLTDYLHQRWLVEWADRIPSDELLFAFPNGENASGIVVLAGDFTW